MTALRFQTVGRHRAIPWESRTSCAYVIWQDQLYPCDSAGPALLMWFSRTSCTHVIRQDQLYLCDSSGPAVPMWFGRTSCTHVIEKKKMKKKNRAAVPVAPMWTLCFNKDICLLNVISASTTVLKLYTVYTHNYSRYNLITFYRMERELLERMATIDRTRKLQEYTSH